MPSEAFDKFWRTDLTREGWLSYVSQADLKHLRLACRDFAHAVAPTLFQRLSISFSTNTFSRHSRMLALERIGHHTKSLEFRLAQNSATFLPPLIAPDTLEELTFVYEPHTYRSRPVSASSSTSSSSSPKSSRYGSWDVDDILVRHFPPIFHSATNIPAFCRALKALPNIRSIGISCAGQDPAHIYRRDAVDFALISLRVAIEQANPLALDTLTLNSVHPGAIFSLRPQGSYGSSPASTRVWRRITNLVISMNSFDYGHDLATDHLKILHTYLQSFSALEDFDFEWLGQKGPCPLSLDAEPCTSRPSSLYSSNACPETSARPSCKPIRFRKLRRMHVRNATMDASQAAAFIKVHRKVLHEFSFDDCSLRSGTWDDALAPLSHMDQNGRCKHKPEVVEVVEVPLIMARPEEKRDVECIVTTLWADEHVRHRGYQTIKRIGSKTRAMVPPHVKRFLKNVRLLAWQI